MKRIINYLALLLITVACKQDLCDPQYANDNSALQFTYDWSQSNIDTSKIHNVSIYAYPEDGSSPYLKVSGNIESGSINLPTGFYSLLSINDVVGDIKNLNLSNSSSLDTFTATLIEQSSFQSSYFTLASNEIAAYNHGQLASWVKESFEVTPDMVSCPYCGKVHSKQVTLSVTPLPITTQCIFTIRVEHIYNAQFVECYVSGFAKGAKIATGERLTQSKYTYVYNVPLSRTYDQGSTQNGLLTGEITTFGKVPSEDQSYELKLYVILGSGELMSYKRDITDQVISSSNITIKISLISDENMISLPEGVGTGFEVESWGDKGSIELL